MDPLLIDRIYECAFVPEQWPDTLDALSQMSEGAGGSLYIFGKDATMLTASPSARERAIGALKGGFAQRGQGLARVLASSRSSFITERDIMTSDELEQEPLYRDFWRPAGIGSMVVTTIELPTRESLLLLFTRWFQQGPAGRGLIDQLDRLRPHLARSALMTARLQLERARVASKTLAALGLPALILDRRGKVLVANDLIEDIPGFVHWRAYDGVSFNDKAADRLLRDAITTIELAQGASVRSFPVRGAEGARMVAHIVPIRLSARDIFASCAATLILTPLTAPEAPPVELVQSLFDLTPAEARVARSLATGDSVEEIATRSGVTLNTIRTQVRGVLEKTGCSRQAEVVSLLAGTIPSVRFGAGAA
jgi:DNA-binding CsgD family transcriptional regulator